MSSALENFYIEQEEPQGSCFIALRSIIQQYKYPLTEHWKYGAPFFYYQKRPFCYLWLDKKTKEPYIGMSRSKDIHHPALDLGSRKAYKVMPISPHEDIPVRTIYEVFDLMIKTFE